MRSRVTCFHVVCLCVFVLMTSGCGGGGGGSIAVTPIAPSVIHNEWAWMGGPQKANQLGEYGVQGTGAAGNLPGNRGFASTWTDSSGSLWLFGGTGNSAFGGVIFNDLWKYDGRQWTWMSGSSSGNQLGVYGTLGVAAQANVPGARYGAASWTDLSGNLWLFGGFVVYTPAGEQIISGYFNDLWKYSSGQWTWMGGSTSAGARGVYGTLGAPASENVPGARTGAVTWTDHAGNFWLFGGAGFDSNGTVARLNDLWKYSHGQWVWMSGSKVADQQGVYGAQGTPSPDNQPGARLYGSGWVDASGSLYLFGGSGFAADGFGVLNDLWKFSDGQWTWIGGSNLTNQAGVFGTQGVADPANVPSGRYGAIVWSDSKGNPWLFGGNGMRTDSFKADPFFDDLWKYSGGQWTWMGGSKAQNQPGVYGTPLSQSPTNMPGARSSGAAWIDSSGSLWLFGGTTVSSNNTSGMDTWINDVWMYQP